MSWNRFVSRLRLRQRDLLIRSIYNWGNYDVSSGECCPMRDKQTTDCARSSWKCPPKQTRCFEAPSFVQEEYPMFLQEIYNRREPPLDRDCSLKLIRHDMHYKPSDKHRRYQRTWPECPLIWLRPKDTCCPDPECCPPAKRRPRPPPRPPLSVIDKHLFHMEMFCKAVSTATSCKAGRRPPSCKRIREVSDCSKTPAPWPSFSEVCRHLLPKNCRQECACLTTPSTCDMWSKYNRRKQAKICTKPLIGYKPRMKFPY